MTKIKNVDALVHKKSAVKDKLPTASQLELGELAVNFNHESPMISFKADDDSIVKISPVAASDSPTAITVDNQNQQILLDVKKPDDTTVQLSGDATNIIFEGDVKNGLEVDNHELNIKIDSASTSGLTVSQDGIKLSPDSAISSSSTNVVENKVLYEELDKKLDKINFINNLYPKGSIYITYEYKNPSTFIGGQWELIGGEDANKNYYPAFAISTDTAGTTINESLPNIKGSVALQSAFNNTFAAAGAFSQDTTLYEEVIDGSGERKRGTVWFNAHNSNSTYQDGAHVNVNAIKIFFWRRTDDATIVEQITPLDVDVEDVLWEGSQGAATNVTITLSDGLEKYKYLKFYSKKDENNMVDNVDVKDINVTTSSLEIIKEHGWDSALRYYRFHKTSDTTFEMDLVDLTLYKITGIRNVPTSDATAEVTDALWQGSQGEGDVNLTLSNNFEGYNKLKLTFLIGSWVMIRYIDTTDVKPNVLFDLDWSTDTARFCFFRTTQPTSGNQLLLTCSATVSITKVEGIKRYSAIDITAGDGINISDTGVVSVAPLQKVTCTKTSLIGNEFYFGGEYYPALKTVHIHGGFAPTTSIGNGSGICRLTIDSQQVVFDDNVIGYVMCNNNATYMRFCQSAINTNQITARDLTIETGRFYWLDLWCPAHLA